MTNVTFATGVCGAALLAFNLAASASPTANGRVYEPGEDPFDQSYAVWTMRWLQHMLSIPADTNPIADSNGGDCGIGQSGKVWYLAGNFGGTTHRTCSVPDSTALLLPIDNIWFVITQDDVDANGGVPPTVTDIATLLHEVVDGFVKPNLRLSIDGRPVTGLGRYRYYTGPFAFWNPDSARSISGPASFPGTNYPALGEGYYVMLKPLSAGHHTVAVAADDGDFSLDVSYDLTVIAAH